MKMNNQNMTLNKFKKIFLNKKKRNLKFMKTKGQEKLWHNQPKLILQ